MYSTHLVIQGQVPHLDCPVFKTKKVKLRKKIKCTGVLVLLHTLKMEINNVIKVNQSAKKRKKEINTKTVTCKHKLILSF